MTTIRTFSIDCKPGIIRPGDLAIQIFKEISIPVTKPVSCSFGEWTWEIDVSDEKWEIICPIIIKKITEFYNNGIIRYGSWS